MEPKNGGLEDDFPFLLGHFQVPAVNFPGYKVTIIIPTNQCVESQKWGVHCPCGVRPTSSEIIHKDHRQANILSETNQPSYTPEI